MLELGTWDEALGDSRVLVMSESARRALAPGTFAQLSGCTDTVLAVPVPTIERLGGGSVRCMLAEVFRLDVTELLVKAGLSYLLGCGGREPGHRAPARGRHSHPGQRQCRAPPTRCAPRARRSALTVLVIDLAKGWLATRLARAPHPAADRCRRTPALEAWSVPVCALAVMLGHIYPVWFGFRGGKGVATLVGVLLGISGGLLLPCSSRPGSLAVMLIGYVGLASIAGRACGGARDCRRGAVTRRRARRSSPSRCSPRSSSSTPIAATSQRMRAGTESRARRLWLFGRGTPA